MAESDRRPQRRSRVLFDRLPSPLEAGALILFGLCVLMLVSLMLDPPATLGHTVHGGGVFTPLYRVFGAGTYGVCLLTAIWCAIVFFRARVGDAWLKVFGILAFGSSIAALFAVLAADNAMEVQYGGTVGAAVARGLGGLSPLLSVPLIAVVLAISAVFATDWFFQGLIRGDREFPHTAALARRFTESPNHPRSTSVKRRPAARPAIGAAATAVLPAADTNELVEHDQEEDEETDEDEFEDEDEDELEIEEDYEEDEEDEDGTAASPPQFMRRIVPELESARPLTEAVSEKEEVDDAVDEQEEVEDETEDDEQAVGADGIRLFMPEAESAEADEDEEEDDDEYEYVDVDEDEEDDDEYEYVDVDEDEEDDDEYEYVDVDEDEDEDVDEEEDDEFEEDEDELDDEVETDDEQEEVEEEPVSETGFKLSFADEDGDVDETDAAEEDDEVGVNVEEDRFVEPVAVDDDDESDWEVVVDEPIEVDEVEIATEPIRRGRSRKSAPPPEPEGEEVFSLDLDDDEAPGMIFSESFGQPAAAPEKPKPAEDRELADIDVRELVKTDEDTADPEPEPEPAATAPQWEADPFADAPTTGHPFDAEPVEPTRKAGRKRKGANSALELAMNDLVPSLDRMRDKIANLETGDGEDLLYRRAAREVVAASRATPRSIQKALNVDLIQANEIMARLESEGIIGPQVGRRQTREVLITPREFEELRDSGAL